MKNFFLVLVFLAAFLFIGSMYIKKEIQEKIKSIPNLQCEEIALSFWSNSIDLNGLSILINLALENKKNQESLDIRSSKISLRRISYWKLLMRKELQLTSVIVQDVSVATISKKKDNPEVTKIPQKERLLNKILVKEFIVQKGKLDLQYKNFKTIDLDNFTSNISNFQIDLKKDVLNLDWDAITFSGKGLQLDNEESDCKLLAATLDLKRDSTLMIHDLKWKPKFSKATYLDRHPYRKALVNLKVAKLQVAGLNIKDVFLNKKIQLREIETEGADLHIYSDKNTPLCPDCIRVYPYERLQNSSWLIDIDSFKIKNLNLTLQTLAEDKEKTGQLAWKEVYASIYNITNNPLKTTTHRNTVADIQATFLKDSKMEVHLEFPNFKKNQPYRFCGNVEKVKLKQINTFLVFAKNLRIKQGYVKRFSFDGSGDLTKASGKVKLQYEDLAIELIKKDNTPRKLLSNMVNKLLTKRELSKEGELLQEGKMYFEREKQKSFFANWWFSLQSGLKSIILPDLILKEELKTK